MKSWLLLSLFGHLEYPPKSFESGRTKKENIKGFEYSPIMWAIVISIIDLFLRDLHHLNDTHYFIEVFNSSFSFVVALFSPFSNILITNQHKAIIYSETVRKQYTKYLILPFSQI